MLQRTETGSSSITVSDAKAWMKCTSESRDGEIAAFLSTAIRRIEDVKNVSLRPMTVLLMIDSPDGFEPLYLRPIREIVAVRDAVSGDGVNYRAHHDFSQISVQTTRGVVVEYKTSEVESLDDYKSAVLTLTSLLFDGITEESALRQIFTTHLTPGLL